MLYLIRHADAVHHEDDAARQLSAEGCAQVDRLAKFLRGGGQVQPEEIWHSSLVRAKQTAALLAEGLGLRAPLREVAGLTPDDNPGAIVSRLKAPREIAIVGHEPHLSGLASLLVAGAAEPTAFMMRKCAILALERVRGGDAACWAVCWHVAPELLV